MILAKHYVAAFFAASIGIGVFAIDSQSAHAQQKKPNIVVIWGDDIGQFNVSAYNMGMMG